jgi:hypothetical protein
MKKLLLLLIVPLAGFMEANAQTAKNPGEVFIQQATFDHNDAVKQFTGDFVTMFEMDFDAFDESGENSNTAIVNQYGNNNTTGITQNGWGNKALVNLLGDYNTTGLEQSGSDNQFILNLEGSNNSVTGQQRGSQNSLRLDLIGTLNNQTFSQIGNNLTLELVDNGSSGVPLQIEQRGDGATVRVENY